MEQSINISTRRIIWLEIPAIILALCGAFIAVSGAVGVYTSQVSEFNAPMWPLPGLVLTYWALLGTAVLVNTVLFMWVRPNKLLYASWAISGAFIPLVLIGAMSIGMAVLFGFVFSWLSLILSTISRKGKFITSLGYFILGIFISAGILLATIALLTPQAFAGINQ